MLIGCHGLVWSGSFGPQDLVRVVEQTRSAGFNLLELPLLDPDSFDLEGAREILTGSGLTITASLGQGADTDPLSEDTGAVDRAVAKLTRVVDILADLGSTHLVGVLYSQLAKYLEPASAAARARAVSTIRQTADHAATKGITVGLEVVNRYETNLFNTAREALVFLDEVDRENVGIHLDTYHMNIEEPNMVAPVLEAAERLVYVHIGESHRGYLGSGTVDFPSFFEALARTEYEGPIVFESFSNAVVDEQLSRTLAVWRNMWSDSLDLGAHAHRFISDHLHAARHTL